MRQNEATDIVVLAVFGSARERGEGVTIELVREVMAELESHPSRCCEACEAVRKTQPEQVYRISSAWFSAMAATHRRALD